MAEGESGGRKGGGGEGEPYLVSTIKKLYKKLLRNKSINQYLS